MKHWTLRTRITFWSALVNAAALLVFGGAAAAVLFFRLEHALDRRLAEDAAVYFSDLNQASRLVAGSPHDPAMRFKSSARLLFYAAGPRTGQPRQVFPERFAPLLVAWPLPAGATTVHFEGLRIRIGAFDFNGTTIVVGSNLHSIDETVLFSLGAYLLTLPAVLLTVALGSAWVARRSLEPITALTEAAAGISASRLDARLPQPPTNDEIGRHIRVLNEMFERLQRGLEQATRFTADASHELRTPLTILRGEIEEALRSGHLGEAQERTLLGLLEQVDRLQKITATLLLLARFDAGKTPLNSEAVDLSALVAEGAEDAGLLAARTGLRVQAEIQDNIRAKGDPLLLRRVVLNLVDNAVRHNRAGGHVRLKLRRNGDTGEAVFTINNTGSGIPRERQSEVFKRFFRLASDRNRESGGAGLGLSLCREIVSAHGGQIALTRGDPDDTEFTVTLPPAE
ncbi:MAG: ATP-binding protein [Verrucomicrobiota bacterium]